MTSTELIAKRLTNQQLSFHAFNNVSELAGWMGAMQAQDYNMVKWAIGMRLINGTTNQVEEAINSGQIIRTHLLRPTWHFVSSDDVYWMLQLNAHKIKSSMKARHEFLGLTPEIIKKSQKIIEKMLINADFVERDVILTELIAQKAVKDNLQVNHLLTLSEQDGIICSGPEIKNKQSYSLLEKRVPVKNLLSRDESIVRLVRKYFQSHGPATMQDFVWWSGLNVSEAKKGIEANKPDLNSVSFEGSDYWHYPETTEGSLDENMTYLLPAFDEFVISYKERGLIISNNIYSKLISDNGIFRPVIFSGNQAVGLWKRVAKKNQSDVELLFFDGLKKNKKSSLEHARSKYLLFKNSIDN
jgi:hypothetical protein